MGIIGITSIPTAAYRKPGINLTAGLARAYLAQSLSAAVTQNRLTATSVFSPVYPKIFPGGEPKTQNQFFPGLLSMRGGIKF